MDQTFLLALVVALVVALAALGRVATRANPGSRRPPVDTGIAVATEGMIVCPKCATGSLSTELTCPSCGTSLRG